MLRARAFGNDVSADPPQAIVGDTYDPLVGLNGAERIIRALGRLGTRERVEQRALTDVGQPDDASFS